MAALRQHLDLEDPFDAAVWACLTTTFFTACRLGEFTVPTLIVFDRALHISPSQIHTESDRHGLTQTVFSLPHTKTSHSGEDVYWATVMDIPIPRR